MITLEDFRTNAQVEGICDEYRDAFLSCVDKKQLMDMALGIKGADYLCNAISKGWGISPDEITKRFKGYLNGRYVFDNGKYTSTMYCQCSDDTIECETTLLTLIECKNITLNIPQNHICRIFTCVKCSIDIRGKGSCEIVCYGDYEDLKIIADIEIEHNIRYNKDKQR